MQSLRIYSAWGMNIASELPLPELTEGGGPPDVTVRLRKGPAQLECPGNKIVTCRAWPTEFHMRVRNTAEYHVAEAKEITIVPLAEYNEEETRLFLLGSAFGALLQQMGFLTLHGSCAEIAGQGVIFTGESGVGKSTLAAAFYQSGYRMISDDVCAIKTSDDGLPMIYPGPPCLKLWKDAAEKLGRETADLSPLLQGYDKYRFKAVRDYSDRPVRLQKIFVLNTHTKSKITVTEITGPQKAAAVLSNTYRYSFLRSQDLLASHFMQCVSVAKYIRVYDIFRPEKPFLMNELIKTVTEACLSSDNV